MLVEILGNVPTVEMTFPKPELPKLVEEYVALVEIQRTNVMCKCPWDVHPDDIDVPEGCCIVCHYKKDAHEKWEEGTEEFAHVFQGRRMKRKDDHPECPVHTKEGFILGFFEWAIETKGT